MFTRRARWAALCGFMLLALTGTIPAVEAGAAPPAPDFTLVDRTGKKVSLRDFRGRVVLMDVWATWCGPCRSSMPEIQKWHTQYGKKGLAVLGVNIEGRLPKVVKYIDDNRFTFTVLFDQGNWKSQFTKLYGVSAIPRSFLVDRQGMLIWAGHPMQLNDATLRKVLAGGTL